MTNTTGKEAERSKGIHATEGEPEEVQAEDLGQGEETEESER